MEEPTVLRVPVMWHYPRGFTLQVATWSPTTPQVAPEGVATWSQGCCDLLANTTVT